MGDKFSNELSNAELERLALLSEELGEAQQCIGKIIRHGYESGSPLVDYISNRALLERELGDIQAAVGMMVHAGDVSESEIERRISVKIVSIQRWLRHQPEYNGTLKDVARWANGFLWRKIRFDEYDRTASKRKTAREARL